MSLSDSGRIIGRRGGIARAAKLSKEERTAIARVAAETRWKREKEIARRSRRQRRISLADFLALPTENPLTGAWWRTLDDDGRALLIEPDKEWPYLGLKVRPIVTVTAAS